MNYDIPFIKDRTIWSQASLEKDESWTYKFTKNDIEELNVALNRVNDEGVVTENINQDNFNLDKLAEKLVQIQDYIENDRGIFLLRGLPVEKYSITNIRRLYYGICSYIGKAVVQSTGGELMQDVCDSGEGLYGDDGRGTNTKERLPWHTDRSDVVSLLCINTAAHGGASMVASLTNLYNIIRRKRPDLAEVLCQPFYHARAPFEPDDLSPWYELPIFTMFRNKFAARYLRHFIQLSQNIPEAPRLSALQLEALDYIDEHLNHPEIRVDMEFEPGDIQFLNNFTVVHSRDEYTNNKKYSRHLLRIWLSVPNSRALTDNFYELYGNTQAGALRGGILNTPSIQQIA